MGTGNQNTLYLTHNTILCNKQRKKRSNLLPYFYYSWTKLWPYKRYYSRIILPENQINKAAHIRILIRKYGDSQLEYTAFHANLFCSQYSVTNGRKSRSQIYFDSVLLEFSTNYVCNWNDPTECINCITYGLECYLLFANFWWNLLIKRSSKFLHLSVDTPF